MHANKQEPGDELAEGHKGRVMDGRGLRRQPHEGGAHGQTDAQAQVSSIYLLNARLH